MTSILTSISAGSGAASIFFDENLALKDRLLGDHYGKLALSNASLCLALWHTFREGSENPSPMNQLLAFGAERFTLLSAKWLGQRCEAQDSHSKWARGVRAGLAASLSLRIAIVGLAGAILLAWGRYVEIAAALGVYAAKSLCHRRMIPIHPDALDIAVNLVRCVGECLQRPLAVSQLTAIKELVNAVARVHLNRRFANYIATGLRGDEPAARTPPLKSANRDQALSVLNPIHRDPHRRLRLNSARLRPLYPPLERANAPLEDLCRLFAAINWNEQRGLVLRKLGGDLKWNLSEPARAQLDTGALMRGDTFLQSEVWLHVKSGFERFAEVICTGALLERSAFTLKEIDFYARYLIQEGFKLLPTQPDFIADQLLHLAVNGGFYCHQGHFKALFDVFVALIGTGKHPLEEHVRRILYRQRETSCLQTFSQSNADRRPWSPIAPESPKVHDFHVFKAVHALDWGLNPAGTIHDFFQESEPLVYYLTKPVRCLRIHLATSGIRLVDALDEAVANRELSMVALINWLLEVVRRLDGEGAEELIEELASTDPKFFGVPIHPDHNRDVTRLNRRILLLLLLDFGYLQWRAGVDLDALIDLGLSSTAWLGHRNLQDEYTRSIDERIPRRLTRSEPEVTEITSSPAPSEATDVGPREASSDVQGETPPQRPPEVHPLNPSPSSQLSAPEPPSSSTL